MTVPWYNLKSAL